MRKILFSLFGLLALAVAAHACDPFASQRIILRSTEGYYSRGFTQPLNAYGSQALFLRSSSYVQPQTLFLNSGYGYSAGFSQGFSRQSFRSRTRFRAAPVIVDQPAGVQVDVRRGLFGRRLSIRVNR